MFFGHDSELLLNLTQTGDQGQKKHQFQGVIEL
jgi:hypothetical protein